MRYPGLIALAAFLAACTPAGMAPPTASVPVTPDAAATTPVAPAAAPATGAAPAAPAAEETQVEISGEVLAPAGYHAAGSAAPAGLWLLSAGEKPVAKAPVQFLDPITKRVVGETKTDDQGRYKLQLGVKIAQGGKVLKVSVDLVDAKGRPHKLYSLTRIDKEAGTKFDGTNVNSATHALARQLDRLDPAKLESRFVLSDFVTAVQRLDAALRSEDLDALDLSDPIALSTILKDIAEGDTTLGDLVGKLEGDDDAGDDGDEGEDGDDSGSTGGSSGGGGSNDDDDDVDEDDDSTDVDEDPDATDADDGDDDEEPTTRTPILSGTIQ